MPTDDEPSRRDFEHLSHSVAELSQTIKEFNTMLELNYVRKDVYARDQDAHKVVHADQAKDIADLTDWKDWALRIIVGAVMLALLGLVIVQR
jgi:hypothetical protein